MSRCAGRERGDGGVAECCGIVFHENVGAADQGTILAGHRPPDEGAVARIELPDALVGFDHLRARHADTSVFGYDQRRAAASYQPTAVKAARRPVEAFLCGDRHALAVDRCAADDDAVAN